MPVSVPVKLLPPKPGSQGFANSIVAAPSTREKPASSMSDDEMPVLVRMTLSPPHSPQGAAPHPPAVSCCSAPTRLGWEHPFAFLEMGQPFQGHWPELRHGLASRGEPPGCLGRPILVHTACYPVNTCCSTRLTVWVRF